MRREFTVSTAIVTGASSGIGSRAVARLRARGVRVLATDVSPRVVDQYANADGVIAVAGDITSNSFVAELQDRASEGLGRVDRLVHSAGIMPGGRVRNMDPEAFQRVMSVNYTGTVLITKAVLPQIRRRGAGEIVVLGSLTGYVPTPGFAAYSASKAAVNTYVETLANEERTNGIHVLLVAPTGVKTPLLNQASGGPGFVQKLAAKDSSPLMLTTDQVLDDAERALTRSRSVITPGGRIAYLARRISPGASWRLAEAFDR